MLRTAETLPVSGSTKSPECSGVHAIAELRGLLRARLLQVAALTIFCVTIGAIAFRLKFSVLDPDIWWHLKVGDWIVEQGAVPHTGILSRTAASRPWVAYSWGYEVLLSRAYAWFGLIGIGIFGVVLTLAVAFSVYWMLRRLSQRFWIAWAVAAVTCWAFLFSGMPRPFFFSIILFCVTVTLLFEANRRGRVETLFWLPLVFVVWANLHIQFVYGLFALGLFVAVQVGLKLADAAGIATPGFLTEPTLPASKLLLLLLACWVGTLIGPNFYHPYAAVYAYSKSKFAYSVIVELQALSFRGWSHYVELMLTAAAFFVVGWQKKLGLYKLSLLTFASVVAFRTMRDAWFICIPAAASLADAARPEFDGDASESWLEKAAIAAVAAALLAIAAGSTGFTSRGLDRAISSQYPVNAINFLRQNPVPGPLYNNLNWGGFLMWYMPEYPVAVDGRNDLYGDELDKIFYAVQSASASYKSDPYLNEAGVVLLDSDLPLAKILTIDPRFELAYHDQIATVFRRR